MKNGIHVDEDDNDEDAEGIFVAEEVDFDDEADTELLPKFSGILCWECCCWFSMFLPLVILWLLDCVC